MALPTDPVSLCPKIPAAYLFGVVGSKKEHRECKEDLTTVSVTTLSGLGGIQSYEWEYFHTCNHTLLGMSVLWLTVFCLSHGEAVAVEYACSIKCGNTAVLKAKGIKMCVQMNEYQLLVSVSFPKEEQTLPSLNHLPAFYSHGTLTRHYNCPGLHISQLPFPNSCGTCKPSSETMSLSLQPGHIWQSWRVSIGVKIETCNRSAAWITCFHPLCLTCMECREADLCVWGR